jgi:acyl-CoA reductase-like NAD-dependent aldehyde dehydrogenase
LDKAEAHIADAKKQGGQIITGGHKLHGTKGYDGYFFEPTIVGKATRQMLVSQEEQFSPILAIFEFDTEDEVVKQANDTSMGLASCKSLAFRMLMRVLTIFVDFFTKNVDRTWRLLENLEAGMIGMNTGNSSAAESPFGGIKESGYGKESGKDVGKSDFLFLIDPLFVANLRFPAVNEYLITKTGTLTLADHY